MEKWWRLALGAVLILSLASGLYTGWSRAHFAAVNFTWIPAHDGPAEFGLILDAKVWSRVTEHREMGWTDALLDAQVHARINALVEYGMRTQSGACPHRWLMSNVQQLADGAVFFSGFCASAEELRRARGDRIV